MDIASTGHLEKVQGTVYLVSGCSHSINGERKAVIFYHDEMPEVAMSFGELTKWCQEDHDEWGVNVAITDIEYISKTQRSMHFFVTSEKYLLITPEDCPQLLQDYKEECYSEYDFSDEIEELCNDMRGSLVLALNELQQDDDVTCEEVATFIATWKNKVKAFREEALEVENT